MATEESSRLPDEPEPYADVEFPDAFLSELSIYIPDAEWRDFLLERAVRPEASRNWRHYMLPELPIDGALGTDDGYRRVPHLWLWFTTGQYQSSRRWVVFNRASLREPHSEVEDDTG